MKNSLSLIKAIICTIGLFCCLTSTGQLVRGPKKLRDMMKDSRETDGPACMIITSTNDTIRGKKLEYKWNKKEKISMYRIGDKEVRIDSIRYYQDENGFHALLILRTLDGKYFDNWNIARIVKGKTDVYINNWNIRPGSNYIPGQGYDTNNSRWPEYNFWITGSSGNPASATYNSLKEKVKNHPAALAQFKKEFPSAEKPDERIKDWKKIQAVIEIYNQG